MPSRPGIAALQTAARSSAPGNLARVANRMLMRPWARPTAFAVLTLPLGWLIWAAFYDQLGANPAEALIRSLGDWTLRILVLVVAITPLRVTLGLSALARWRRMVGLFVFFYASLHLTAYAWFDMGFVWGEVLSDVSKRPFILVGMLSWGLLLLLALTSFNRAMRWMGPRRWQWLHRSVYGVCGLAILHFFWMRAGKNDFVEVAVYASTLSALLGWRAWRRFKARVRPDPQV
jgi:sulfoxide reductase heme-binding subunit YedZ